MDNKWVDPGKLLGRKDEIRAIGLNNASATAPSSPENGEPWKDTTNNEYQVYSTSDWLSVFLTKGVKRTTNKTNGPYLHELIDSKNSITDNTSTAFINVSIPNANLGASIIIEYVCNSDTALVYRSGQVHLSIGRVSGSATEATIHETIADYPNKTAIGYIYNSDIGTDVIFQNSGFSDTVIASFSSPSTACHGVAFDSPNLISSDEDSGKIYLHENFSDTITDCFTAPEVPQGVAWDGTDLYFVSESVPTIFQQSGFSDTVQSSFASPSTGPSGCGWDTINDNLLTVDNPASIYVHSGFSDSISTSFSSPSTSPQDVSIIANDILSSDNSSDWIYKHSGQSATISSSFSSPSTGAGAIQFYASTATIISIAFGIGSITGATSTTQTMPITVRIATSDAAAGNIRYSARIISGGKQDNASGCEVTLAAA